MLRFVTAGESHGQALVAWISGLPAGVPVDMDFIARELHRRQLGFGRGGRQRIEKDHADILAGVRHGKTIGAPIALRIENRDWKNWEKALPVEDSDGAEDVPAVFGIVAGSWTPEIAARVPTRTRVVICTHDDPAGDRYAAQIAETLRERCPELRRLRPVKNPS